MKRMTLGISLSLVAVAAIAAAQPVATPSGVRSLASQPAIAELNAITEYQKRQIAELTIELDQVKRSLTSSPETKPATAPRQGNIVTGGDFEFPISPRPFVSCDGGITIGGWTTGLGGIDWVGSSNHAASGAQSLDLSCQTAGFLYQDLLTVPGQRYQLRFAMAGGPEAPVIKKMKVEWGTTIVDQPTFNATGRSVRNMGWTYHTYEVTATSEITRLKFTSLVETPYGPMIDDVQVVPTGPTRSNTPPGRSPNAPIRP